MISQNRISATLLLAVRQTEAQRGTLLAHHGRHPAALRPTEARRHRITDRAARKAKARERCNLLVAGQAGQLAHPRHRHPRHAWADQALKHAA